MRTKYPLLMMLAAVLLVASTATLTGCSTSHRYHGIAVNGSVHSVDVDSHTLSLDAHHGAAPATLSWNTESKFWASGLRIEPRQLRPGDLIKVHLVPGSDPKIIQHLFLETNRTIH